jgi:two-component system sensor histidine kinase TctE
MAKRLEKTRFGFGLRTRLLILLLPGMITMLAFDSWNDYKALNKTVNDAYDQALLEPISALEGSIGLATNGSIHVQSAFDVQRMFNEIRTQHKHLHVGLKPFPLSPENATANSATLMGVHDLPPVPPALRMDLTSRAELGQSKSSPVWYDSRYRGYPVRIAALERIVLDGDAKPWYVLIQAAESTGQRQQASDDSLRQELLRDVRMLVLVVLLISLGVAWSLRPLELLRKKVLASPPDDLVPLDASAVPHEVAPLVEAVNHHMSSHRQVLSRQAEFLADASHQLRTPLAIMQTQATYALRQTDIGHMQESLRAIITQLSRSRRLSEQLLALAHASEPQEASLPCLLDLNLLARRVVLQYLPLAHEKNQDLGWVDARGEDAGEIDFEDNFADDFDTNFEAATKAELRDLSGDEQRKSLNDEQKASLTQDALQDNTVRPAADLTSARNMAVPANAHEAQLHEALSNLIHNAIAYTPAGGSITVSAFVTDGMACIEVSDSGPGIAPDKREAVFERFAQLAGKPLQPAPGQSAHHGAGLGMAIARAYARHSGGDIVLSDGETRPEGGCGLRAKLCMPAEKLPV